MAARCSGPRSVLPCPARCRIPIKPQTITHRWAVLDKRLHYFWLPLPWGSWKPGIQGSHSTALFKQVLLIELRGEKETRWNLWWGGERGCEHTLHWVSCPQAVLSGRARSSPPYLPAGSECCSSGTPGAIPFCSVAAPVVEHRLAPWVCPGVPCDLASPPHRRLCIMGSSSILASHYPSTSGC